MTTTAIEVTENSKTGPISATYTSQKSCPDSCAFRNAGCYAELGFIGITTNKVNKSRISDPKRIALLEAKQISKLTGRNPLRLHVVGDTKTNGAAKILAAAAVAYSAKKGSPVFTYTHAWRKVSRASWGNISVLASVEKADDIAKARNKGYAAAIVVERFDSPHRYELNGEKVIPCPAQTKKNIQCVDCKLCFKSDFLFRNKLSVGFEAHGAPATKARALRTIRGL